MAQVHTDIARSWIGTPYRHQASVKGVGTDCLGLLRGIWRETLGAEPVDIPAYTADWSEPQGEEALWDAACIHLLPKSVNEIASGDVILFRMRAGSVAKHLGVQGNLGCESSFIHAYSEHGVLESPLSGPWQRCIVARFEFPEEVS